MESRIKQLRENRGLIQEILASELGITQQMLSKYERDVLCIKVDVLKRIYLHMIPEFAVVTGIFMMLRSFVGGVHLNSFSACFMCSVTVQTLVLVVNRLYTQPLNAAWGIIVLSSILIWNMAPVQSINRELDADEKRHCRKVAVKIIAGIYVFAGICTLTGMKAIVSLVAVTMAVVLISQYIGVVKYKIEKR